MATIRENEDLISVGAYVPGTNTRIDEAFSKREAIDAFLRQSSDGLSTIDEGLGALRAL